MIRYIPTTATAAPALTAALWALALPPDECHDEVTSTIFPIQTALDGSTWLQVETTFEIRVHPEAVLDGIADLLQPWIDAGQLPADTNTALDTQVRALRGQPLVVYDAFPVLFKTLSKTPAEMISAGLLAEYAPS